MESAGGHSHSTNSTKNSAGTADKSLTGWTTRTSYNNDISAGGICSLASSSNVNANSGGNYTSSKGRLNIDATHSHTTDTKGVHTHTINSNGGIESRPNNLTYKIWARIA